MLKGGIVLHVLGLLSLLASIQSVSRQNLKLNFLNNNFQLSLVEFKVNKTSCLCPVGNESTSIGGICPAGYFCPEGSSFPHACPAG